MEIDTVLNVAPIKHIAPRVDPDWYQAELPEYQPLQQTSERGDGIKYRLILHDIFTSLFHNLSQGAADNSDLRATSDPNAYFTKAKRTLKPSTV